MAARISRVPPGALLAVLAPWVLLYGGVHAPARALYVVAATIALVAHVVMRTRAGKRVAPGDAPVVIACVVVAWAVIALVPLPAGLVRVVAPATWRIAVEDVARAGVSPRAWLPIAIEANAGATAVATALAHLAIFVVAAATFGGRRGARALAGMLVLGGAGISILAIMQAFTHAERIYFFGLRREQFYGTFVNGNHTATLLGVCALSGLGLLLRERDFGRRAAWGVAAVVCSVGVLHSLSRGGIFAFAIGLGVFLLGAIATQASARRVSRDEIGRFFTRHAVLLMLLGLAVFYLSWLGPRRIGRELATIAALDLPEDYRVRVWRDSAGIVADWPLTGSGPGTFGEVYPLYRTFDSGVRTEMAESEWVQSAAEGGLPTTVLAVAFVLALLAPFGASYFSDPFRFSGAHLGFAAALVAIAAHAAVDFPLRIPAIGAIAAALAGALVGAQHRRMRRRTVEQGPLERLVRLPKPTRRLRDEPGSNRGMRAAAWIATAPLAWGLLAVGLTGDTDADAAERVRDRPADARAWLALARSLPEGAHRDAAWEIAVARDPANARLRRIAARAWADSGNPKRAADELAKAIAIIERTHGKATDLRIDLAEQLLWAGDLDGAKSALDAAEEKSVRVGLLSADILAAREDVSVDEAISAYIAVTTILLSVTVSDGAGPAPTIHTSNYAGHASPLFKIAAVRAVALALNRAAVDESALTRSRIDRIARALDAGLVLREVQHRVAAGSLDATRIWSGAPYATIDSFDAGEPRLVGATPAQVVEHTIAGGEERLHLEYRDIALTNDVWSAKLSMYSDEPNLALRIRVRSESRLGDQGCLLSSGRTTVWGRLEAPGVIVVRGAFPGTLEMWCFDTRGRPGPWRFEAIEAILSP